MEFKQFLPVNKAELEERGWYYYDFLVVSADAYIDHPSFGTTIIARLLESEGYRVALLAQPPWQDAEAFRAMGKPRYGVFIGGGNIDSMVAHYTAAKKHRSEDLYSPGGRTGLRPDRPTIVYANRAREAFPGTPVIVGGLEASLRRFAHYDYWDDAVRRSILLDSGADLLTYGMGEKATCEIAARLKRGEKPESMTDIRGTAFLAKSADACAFPAPVECPSYEKVAADKMEYAIAARMEHEEHDPVRGRALLQRHGERVLIVNPPQTPLSTPELDRVAELPYCREVHPMYERLGGVPAIEEVRFSVTHNRGCFGDCNFCSLAFHQGRMITCRSQESVIREVEGFTHDPLFKGYVHDVGGPSANFRHPSCAQQMKNGLCRNKSCLAPTPCKNLDADHSDYLKLLRRLRAIPGVKKVFIRSGIRYDYMLEDKNQEFFAELVKYHVSGQLKVAPEHCVSSVLDYMGKPHFEVFEKFWAGYQRLNEKNQKEQYLVPYLMSSHPGCTLSDAVALAEFLHKTGHQPEQVQDFYPTPGTLSTCMYYTGLDPRDLSPVYVAKTPHEKALQRALLQWRRPELRTLVAEALHKAGREDLIGFGKNCLIRPQSAAYLQQARQKKKAEDAPRSGGKKPAAGETACRAPAKKPARNGRSAAHGDRFVAPPEKDGRQAKPPVQRENRTQEGGKPRAEKPAGSTARNDAARRAAPSAQSRGVGKSGAKASRTGPKPPMSEKKKARFQKKRSK